MSHHRIALPALTPGQRFRFVAEGNAILDNDPDPSHGAAFGSALIVNESYRNLYVCHTGNDVAFLMVAPGESWRVRVGEPRAFTEAEIDAARRELAKVAARSALAQLTDRERALIFADYCGACGRDDPRCQCENDA